MRFVITKLLTFCGGKLRNRFTITILPSNLEVNTFYRDFEKCCKKNGYYDKLPISGQTN